MHKLIKWNLTFFDGGAGAGAGGGEGAGDGSAAGATAVVAGQENASSTPSLEDLGVPKAMAEKYRARTGKAAPAEASAETEPQQPTPAEAKPQGEQAPQRDYDGDFKKFLEDPEMNKRMQDIVGNRVKGMRGTLDALMPALEALGKKNNIDVANLNAEGAKALSDAILDSTGYYEEMAADMGSDVETAKRIDQREKEAARREEEAKRFINEQKYQEYRQGLNRQAELLKQEFPDFDLDRELQDERFARLILPQGGLNLEQAYYAKYGRDIKQRVQAAAARQSAQALSNSIQSGRNVPAQNGTTSRATAPVAEKLYSQMTAEERAARKAQYIREAAMRRR